MDPYLWLTDSDPALYPANCVSDFQDFKTAHYFWLLHLNNFSKIKSHKVVTKQKESRFFLSFFLDDRWIPHTVITDPDPGGPKTLGYGSGSATLDKIIKRWKATYFKNDLLHYEHFLNSMIYLYTIIRTYSIKNLGSYIGGCKRSWWLMINNSRVQTRF